VQVKRCRLEILSEVITKSVKPTEGGYWDDRDAEKLLTTVGRWNEMMAGFVGALELATGESLPAPIKDHPQFERLEHFGTTGDTAAMAKAIAAALKEIRPSE
jgi:hypothetical protein